MLPQFPPAISRPLEAKFESCDTPITKWINMFVRKRCKTVVVMLECGIELKIYF